MNATGTVAGSAAYSPFGRIVANLLRLASGKAVAGLLSLVYLAIAARTLGAEGYGVLVLVNAYAVLIGSLVAFSGFHGVVRYGALAIERGDRAALAQIVRFMGVVELAFGLAAIAVAAVLAPVVGPRLGWPPEAVRIAVPYGLAVLATVRATPQGLLQLANRFDLIGLHTLVSPVVRLAGVLIAWMLDGGLAAYLSVWLASSVAEGAVMWLMAGTAWRRLLSGEPLGGPWRSAARDNHGLAHFITVTNFDITLRELAPQLVPLTVGWMMGPGAAGLFALAQRATSVLQQPALLVANGAYSVFADLAARGGGRAFAQAVWRSAGLMAAVATAIIVALAYVGDRLLVWIGGGSFSGGGSLLLLVALARALQLMTTPLGAGLTALGRPQRSMTAGFVANIILYPLLPLLLSRAGLDGAGWHALVQAVVAAAMLGWWFGTEGGR
jgi:O-antigen/teichoic acid export membrane protein